MLNNLTSDSSLNLVYLLILLAVIAVGLLPHLKRSPSKSLRSAAIWIGLMFLLVGVYSFKDDFKQLTSRIKAELMPAYATVKNDGSISFKKSQNGHFYIMAKINGTSIRFLLDTGATDITLSLADAKNAGINTSNLRFDKIYNTANGQVKGAIINIYRLDIGNLQMEDVKASVNAGDMDISLLGMSFLEQTSGYEVRGNTLTIWP